MRSLRFFVNFLSPRVSTLYMVVSSTQTKYINKIGGGECREMRMRRFSFSLLDCGITREIEKDSNPAFSRHSGYKGELVSPSTPLSFVGAGLFFTFCEGDVGGREKNKRKGEKKGPRLISSFDTCDRDYQHVLLFRPPFSSIFLPLFFFDQKWHNCLTDRVGGPLVEMTPTDGFDSVRFFRPINWISAGKTTNGTKRKKVLCQRERNVSWRIEKETMAAK